MTEGDSKTTSQQKNMRKLSIQTLFEVKTPPTFNAEPEKGRFDGEIFLEHHVHFPSCISGV